MNISAHVKYPLFLSDFNATWIFLTDFWKIPKYQISWKSVQWEPSCSMRKDGHTNKTRYDEATVAFRNFPNAPIKTTTMIWNLKLQRWRRTRLWLPPFGRHNTERRETWGHRVLHYAVSKSRISERQTNSMTVASPEASHSQRVPQNVGLFLVLATILYTLAVQSTAHGSIFLIFLPLYSLPFLGSPLHFPSFLLCTKLYNCTMHYKPAFT
jgi:hypothetical protein